MTERPVEQVEDTEWAARKLIRHLVVELTPGSEEVSLENPHLVEDLGYHSLALLELAFTLEDHFDLDPIEQEVAQTIVSVRDVEDYVIEKLREKTAAGSAVT
jgi:acyl carrier protein